MRKSFIYFAIIIFFSFSTKEAQSLIFDYTPLSFASPQFCAQTLPAAITNVTTTAKQVYNMEEQLKSFTSISNLKQMFRSYAMGLGNKIFKNISGRILSNNGIFSYSRLIKETKNIDMHNEEEVKKAFMTMFMQYPSDKEGDKTLYRSLGMRLKMDTAMEILVTVKEMNAVLHGTDEGEGENIKHTEGLLDKINAMEQCLLNATDCDKEGMEEYNCAAKPEGEDKICLWRNALMAANIYNKIMIYNEILTAMDAQYKAVRSINLIPPIMEYKEETENKEENHSYLNKRPTIETARTVMREDNVYAAMDTKSAQIDGNKRKSKATANVFDVIDHAEGVIDPMKGKEDDFASLSLLEDAQSAINEAKRAHNTKQNLHGYKKVFTTYKNLQKLHDATKQKLRDSEQCVQNYLSAYYVNPQKSWSDCSYINNNLYCHYKPEKSVRDNKISKGDYDIACPGDRTHKCFVTDKLSGRDKVGIYGYLLDLYTEAKKQDAQGDIDTYLIEDESIKGISEQKDAILQKSEGQHEKYISVQDEDEEEVSSTNSLLRRGDQEYSKYKEGDSISALRKPSEQEEMDAEGRKNALFNWTLGAIVAKVIVADVQSFDPKFGEKKKSYHLWNDQKEFYDQYIKGKYDNIKDYIEHLSLTRQLTAPFYEAISTGGDEKNVSESELAQIKNAGARIAELLHQDEEQEVADIWKESDTQLLQLRKTYEQSVAQLKARLNAAYKELDNLTDKLDKAQQQYNDSNREVRVAEDTSPQMLKGLEYGEELYADRDEKQKSEISSKQDDQLQSTYSKNNRDKAEAIARKTKAQTQINNLRKQIQAKNIEIEDLQQKIVDSKRVYVRAYNDALYEAKKSIEEAVKEENDNPINNISEELIAQIPTINVVEGIMQCVKKYALQQVDEAYEKITLLQKNESIYLPNNARQVQQIHEDMIEKLTSIKSTDLDCDWALFSIETAVLREALVRKVSEEFNRICKDDYCTTPDSDYFVGIKGKNRDLTAPKEAVNFVSAPLREIFHFDEQDYDNVDKFYPDDDDLKTNENIIVTGESFMNAGLELPEIWKYILRRHAFVEKDIDFKALFHRGNANKEYLRSGRYPCSLNNKVVDVTNAQRKKGSIPFFDGGSDTIDEDTKIEIGDFGYVVDKTPDKADYGKLYKCQSLEFDDGNIVDLQAGGAVNYDKATDNIQGKSVIGSSELGNILSYIPDPRFEVVNILNGNISDNERYKLTFNANLQRAVYNINNYENADDNPREESIYLLSNRSLLQYNQFGGYLDYIEIESSAAQALAGLDNQITELEDSLREIFAELGYTLSSDFDLSKEDDYALALKTLDNYKQNYIRHALDTIGNVNGVTDKIKDDTEKLLHEISVLNEDDDELVNVTGQEDLDEMAEKIKNIKANRSIENEYEQEETDAIMKQINQLPPPYCAVYGR